MRARMDSMRAVAMKGSIIGFCVSGCWGGERTQGERAESRVVRLEERHRYGSVGVVM